MPIQNKHIAVLQVLTLCTIGGATALSFAHKDRDLAPPQATVNLETVRKTIQTAMPNTPIRSVMPGPIDGLYEVTSSSGLLYTDKTGRYLFVGGIYDPETNTDIVKKRKVELGFDTVAARPSSSSQQVKSPSQPQAGPHPMTAKQLEEVKDLAITYREIPGAPVVYELFDPMCGHCRTNHSNLQKLNVTIKKLLVVSQGSNEINGQVYCAIDPKAAIDSLITKNALITNGQSRANCDVGDLNTIKEWMVKYDLPGFTPQTILADSNELWYGSASTSVWKQRLGL